MDKQKTHKTRFPFIELDEYSNDQWDKYLPVPFDRMKLRTLNSIEENTVGDWLKGTLEKSLVFGVQTQMKIIAFCYVTDCETIQDEDGTVSEFRYIWDHTRASDAKQLGGYMQAMIEDLWVPIRDKILKVTDDEEKEEDQDPI